MSTHLYWIVAFGIHLGASPIGTVATLTLNGQEILTRPWRLTVPDQHTQGIAVVDNFWLEAFSYSPKRHLTIVQRIVPLSPNTIRQRIVTLSPDGGGYFRDTIPDHMPITIHYHKGQTLHTVTVHLGAASGAKPSKR